MIPPDPFSTHQASLMLAVAKTSGDILELGAGHYSTPLLHAFASPERRVLTLDSGAEWIREFAAFDSPWHMVRLADDWCREHNAASLAERLGRKWSVCLVDQLPNAARGESIKCLRSVVGVFVCHDTEDDPINRYGYDILKTFPYRRDDHRLPRTSIVSDTIDVRQWPEV